MVRFFEKLNTPRTVGVALAFFLLVNGFLFYRYQKQFEGDNATPIVNEVEAVAAEEPIVSSEPGLSTYEDPTALVKVQEPATEEEIAVPTEAAVPSAEEEEGGVDAVRVVVGVSGAPSWLRIQEDRQVVLDQVSEPGFYREFVGDRAISVEAGNAGAVRVEVDGRDQGPLGSAGEAATRTYTTQKGTEASE